MQHVGAICEPLEQHVERPCEVLEWGLKGVNRVKVGCCMLSKQQYRKVYKILYQYLLVNNFLISGLIVFIEPHEI